MNNDKAKQLSESALTQLISALEQGRSDALQAYLAVMARFHHYSWNNALLIFSQRPNATHVAGFHRWLKLHRFVRRGEKGIVILAPMVGRLKEVDELAETPKCRIFGFRTSYVFDVSQTEGEPLPELVAPEGDPGDLTTKLKAFVAGCQIELAYSNSIQPARGMSSGGRITLLPDISGAEEFSVLVHEVAHELLHRGERRKETTHTIRETEAEAVAFVVSTAIGLETTLSSTDYIQLHSGCKETLVDSLSFVQRTSAEILRAILPTDSLASGGAADSN